MCMKSKVLTKRQAQIFDFILSNIDQFGYPPSIPEVQKRFSFKSPNAVQSHFEALERKGYVSRRPHKSRGIEVLVHTAHKENNNNNVSIIPILGNISAGNPILAQENIEGELAVDKSLAKNPTGVFALKVKGDSMIEAGILDGDHVVVRQQQNAEEGDIIVALIEDEATVKKFYKDKSSNRVILRPANESMKPIYVDLSNNNFMILGKVTGVIRKI
ncbi:MAG: transcriptional repressor LexA [Candidatus Omnitrophica bacterium]|nr:transcriptional repressor LexA [Candidatus Omnitrophota bacterium]